MKLNILFFAIIISVFSIVSFAQENSFELEISLDKTKFWASENVAVKVKITNRSGADFDLAKFSSISFYFSKCSKGKACRARGDVYAAYSTIKSGTLKKDGSAEFEVNLTELYWNDSRSSVMDLSYPKNFITIPATSKYFYADIKLLDKSLETQIYPSQTPVYKSFESNEIAVSVNGKSFQ